MIESFSLYTLEQLRQERRRIRAYLKRLDRAIATALKVKKRIEATSQGDS